MSINSNIFWEPVPFLDICPGNPSQVQKQDVLRSQLKNQAALLDWVLQALRQLQAGNLHMMDGLVGENACQIRAMMFADLCSQPQSQDEILKAIQKVQEVQARYASADISKKQMSMNEVLSHNHLQFSLPKFLLAASTAYILWVTKISTLSIKTNAGDNSRFVLIESSTDNSLLIKPEERTTKKNSKGEMVVKGTLFSEKVDKIARQKLAEYSVDYIQQLAAQLPENEENKELQRFVNGSYVKYDESGRPTIPCFAFMDIINKSAIQRKIPILLTVKRIELDENITNADPDRYPFGEMTSQFYKVVNGDYVYQKETPLPNTPLIVMDGYAITSRKIQDIQAQLQDIPLKDNVLGNDAAHPQYPRSIKWDKEKGLESTRWEDYLKIAKDKGFCRENSSLCFIAHVYPDVYRHQLEFIRRQDGS